IRFAEKKHTLRFEEITVRPIHIIPVDHGSIKWQVAVLGHIVLKHGYVIRSCLLSRRSPISKITDSTTIQVMALPDVVVYFLFRLHLQKATVQIKFKFIRRLQIIEI